jgi:hypothetical protein
MSTTLTNPSIYAPGADITAEATEAVTARRFVAIAGDRASGGNISVKPASSGGRTAGVAGNDAAAGGLVTVVRGNSRVVYVAAAGAIAAGDEVEVGSGGKAKKHASGTAVGYAVTGASDGDNAEISLD